MRSAALARLDRPAPAPRNGDCAEVTLTTARVVADTPALVVRGAAGDRAAVRAAGCLVAPRVGDRVLAGLAAGECYVLTVLERGDDAPVAITPARGDGLEIRAAAVRIEAAEAASVRAPQLSVETRSVHVATAVATLVGRLMTVVGERLRTSVRRQEITADHLAQKLGERVTIVDGADVASAASTLTTVSGVMTTQTGSAVTTAKRDLRFDAERVSVG